MPTKEGLEGEVATAESSVEGSRTILDCFKEYSTAVAASDGTDETRKRLWNEYIAVLKKTPRTISGCMKEYQAAVKALGPAAESPDTKSGLWKTYMTLVKDFPMTPENLRDAGWIVPERGDSLVMTNEHVRAIVACGYRHSLRSLDITALPESLSVSHPNFTASDLSVELIRGAADSRTFITLPELWKKTARGSNALTVEVNGLPVNEVPLEVPEEATLDEVVSCLIIAVREGLKKAAEQVEFLEARHEKGIAAPGPYRLAFNLANFDKEDHAARFAEKPRKLGFEQGK